MYIQYININKSIETKIQLFSITFQVSLQYKTINFHFCGGSVGTEVRNVLLFLNRNALTHLTLNDLFETWQDYNFLF